MKLIIGGANSGKSKVACRTVKELLDAGKKVSYITNEVPRSQMWSDPEFLGGGYSHVGVQMPHIISVPLIVETMLGFNLAFIVVDGVYHSMTYRDLLYLHQTEQYTGVELCITMQLNREAAKAINGVAIMGLRDYLATYETDPEWLASHGVTRTEE